MKRPRRSEEQCPYCAKRKKHLYLALDERKQGGYLGFSIHKLDTDNMEEDALPEPVLRFAAPDRAPMAFTAVGTSIFIATSPHLRGREGNHQEAPRPPTLVYDTETGALTIGPRLPDGYLGDSGGAPTVVDGERLYVLTDLYDDDLRQRSFSLRVLSRTPTTSSWYGSETAIMAWSWNDDNGAPPRRPPPCMGLDLVTSYALHPDGRTIFMSTTGFTWSLDTRDGVWKEVGCWPLPFTGQAYFDGDLDAWVGLHRGEDGYVCCCRVPSRSRSATTTRRQPPPECKMLKDKLFLRNDDDSKYPKGGQHLKTTLTYMGDSRFCLVENVMNTSNGLDATLNVTLFGLRYDRNGDLCTKLHRTTRSYAVSKNTRLFSHAAFWM
jgi:hypothetical protein